MKSGAASVALRGCPGVYTFWAGARCLYVGASRDLSRRPRQSGMGRAMRERGAVHLVLLGCRLSDVFAVEAFLIAALRPELNRQRLKGAAGGLPSVLWLSAPVLVAGQGDCLCGAFLPGLVGAAVPVLPVLPDAVQLLELVTLAERKRAALEADRAAFREHERQWHERARARMAERGERVPVLRPTVERRLWWSDD